MNEKYMKKKHKQRNIQFTRTKIYIKVDLEKNQNFQLKKQFKN